MNHSSSAWLEVLVILLVFLAALYVLPDAIQFHKPR